MNELLFFICILVYFTLLIFCYKLFGKTGLFIWIAISTIIANMQVTKMVTIFGLSATLGNVMFSSIYLATDILSENHGRKDANKSIAIGFFSLICFVMVTQMTLLFVPNELDSVDGAMHTIFSIIPQVCIAGIATYVVSQLFDIWLFEKIKIKTKGKHLWLRNNLATLIAQLIDTTIFTLIAFCGMFDIGVLFEMIGATYILKLIISLLDTPFLYLAKSMNGKFVAGGDLIDNKRF